MKRTLILQVGILAVCAVAVAQMAANFPYPSPLIKPFLPPTLRWPTAQVKAWVESSNVDSGFITYFARDPERLVPPGRNFVSPADGLIQSIVARDGINYFVVSLSFWDVHVVRTPVAGIVTDIREEGVSMFNDTATARELEDMIYLHGKAAPVQAIVTIKTQTGNVVVHLITSYWASRLKLRVRIGEKLEKGQRIGRILLGSTVVAELPGDLKFSVRAKQRVIAGESIIAKEATLP